MLLTETIIESGPEPVTVDEVKVSARIDADITELDGRIGTLIQSARLFAEHECERVFLPRTVRLAYSAWPAGNLPLPADVEAVAIQVLVDEGWQAMGATLVRLADGGLCVVPDGQIPSLPVDGRECVRLDAKILCPANIKTFIVATASYQLVTPTEARPAEAPAYLNGLLDRERAWR